MVALLISILSMGATSSAWPMATVQAAFGPSLCWSARAGWCSDGLSAGAAGTILMAIVALLVVASLLTPSSSDPREPWSLHHHCLGLIFVGLGSFALSFALSVLYLVQRSRLKSKRLEDIREPRSTPWTG